jgi:hypothetical protein
MTALPPASDITGSTRTEGEAKAWLTDVRGFLAGTLGTDGTVATALATLGALGGAYAAKTGAYTVTTADRGKIIEATSGTWTLALPAAASAGSGFSLVVQNSGTGVVTIDPDSAEQVNGAATLTVPAGTDWLLVCTGTAWRARCISRTIQSSSTDATAGRLLTLTGTEGAFGLGGTRSPLCANIDDQTAPNGIYAITASTSGTKPGGMSTGTLYHSNSNDSAVNPTQIAVDRSGNVFAWRSYVSAAWTAWKELPKVETGTWTPVIADAESGGNVGSATVDGNYTAIGRAGAGLVIVGASLTSIVTTGMTAGNDLWIRGFPFASENWGAAARFSAPVQMGAVTFAGVPSLRMQGAASAARISLSQSGAARSNMLVSALTSGSAAIEFSMIYAF